MKIKLRSFVMPHSSKDGTLFIFVATILLLIILLVNLGHVFGLDTDWRSRAICKERITTIRNLFKKLLRLCKLILCFHIGCRIRVVRWSDLLLLDLSNLVKHR